MNVPSSMQTDRRSDLTAGTPEFSRDPADTVVDMQTYFR